jgi:hypothetical protein
MIKLRTIGVAVAAVALAVECAFIPSEASAIEHLTRGGPSESPGGTYFQQGQIVNFCFTPGHESEGWIELNSQALGNCPPGHVQLSVWADPDGVVPGPVATVTVTATPSAP